MPRHVNIHLCKSTVSMYCCPTHHILMTCSLQMWSDFTLYGQDEAQHSSAGACFSIESPSVERLDALCQTKQISFVWCTKIYIYICIYIYSYTYSYIYKNSVTSKAWSQWGALSIISHQGCVWPSLSLDINFDLDRLLPVQYRPMIQALVGLSDEQIALLRATLVLAMSVASYLALRPFLNVRRSLSALQSSYGCLLSACDCIPANLVCSINAAMGLVIASNTPCWISHPNVIYCSEHSQIVVAANECCQCYTLQTPSLQSHERSTSADRSPHLCLHTMT